jgi:hypothetical protein
MVHLVRAGRESEHRLPSLIHAATGEEGEMHPPSPECRRTHAPPPQAPLLPRATMSGAEAERPGTVGVGAIGTTGARGKAVRARATGPLPAQARADPLSFPWWLQVRQPYLLLRRPQLG